MTDAESSSGPDEPIFSLAWECDDLIQKCLTNADCDGLAIKSLVEDYERRFNAWWEYLGVFARRKANLDRRLRRHPEIRDIVVRLLVILRRNLTQLRKCPGSQISLISANRAQSAMTGSEVPDKDVEIADSSSPVTVALEAIDECLMELSHVGIAIRQSARATETTRARRSVAGHHYLTSFEAVTFLAVETLYPNAPQSLQLQLSKSMVDRYARLLFRASRHGLLKTDIRKQTAAEGLATRGGESNIETQEGSGSGKSFKLSERQHQSSPTVAPTSVDLSGFLDIRKNVRHSKSRSGTTTAILGKTPEPPVPQFDGKEEVRCQWCFINIEQSLVNKGRWTISGREHYRSDLEPFPCISEDCIESLPSFSSITSWREHMLSHHSSWTQNIHRQPMWKCPYNHETDALFPTPDHLYGHIRALHKDTYTNLDDTNILERIGRSVVDALRAPNTCPICCFIPKGMESQEQISATLPDGKGLHGAPKRVKSPIRNSNNKRARIAIFGAEPSTTSQTRTSSPDSLRRDEIVTDSKSDELTPVSRAMETHITGHLQFLMVLSLKLMETRTEDVDSEFKDGSMMPDKSGWGSQVDGSESDRDLNDMPPPPLGSPSHRSNSVASDDTGTPVDWSNVAEKRRRLHPELDGDVDSILDHLRTHQIPPPKSKIFVSGLASRAENLSLVLPPLSTSHLPGMSWDFPHSSRTYDSFFDPDEKTNEDPWWRDVVGQ